jgi:hypothetical protein
MPGQEPQAYHSGRLPEASASVEAREPAHALAKGQAMSALEQFQAMKTNTQLCAAGWIAHGSAPSGALGHH